METIISANLMLRLLNIQEFFTHQSLMNYPNDHQKISELINIKNRQLSLQEIIKTQDILNMLDENEEGSGGNEGGGGGSTIRGFRGKNDTRFKNPTVKRR
ncbi:MAG: hypothetical protein ACR2HS_06650 [Gammaproteobacteria bacterium]